MVGVKVVDLTLTWEVAQVEDLTLVVAQAEDLILIWEEDNSKDNLLKKKFLIYLKTQMSNNWILDRYHSFIEEKKFGLCISLIQNLKNAKISKTNTSNCPQNFME